MKRFITLVLAIIMTASLAACKPIFRRGEGDVELDPNRDWIFVGNYNGGLGSAWLQEVIDGFMEENPTWGVYIDNDKDNYTDTTLYTNISTNRQSLYFINGITYNTYINGGKLKDITKTVTEKLPGEDMSIADKMNPSLRDYYATGGGTYYAVPFFDAPFGTVYDVDLFEKENLYFDAQGRMICNVEEYFDNDDKLKYTLDELKSAGPDGDVSTAFDNGLPATYDQWKTLLHTMEGCSVTPYIWTGEYDYYRKRYMASIWADYEGKEAFDLNLSFNGSYKFPGDDTPTKIELSNGYRLVEQPGKKYALDMAHHIISNGYYVTTSFDGVNTHTMAQNSFLLSTTQDRKIAMILEGAWWENEAKDYFNTMASTGGESYAYGKRRFGFMPVPKASADLVGNSDMTMISSTGNSVICRNANVNEKQEEIATAFLKYVHSDKSLKTFTRVTGSIRPYDYELTENETKEMSYFSTQMWDLYHSDKANISYVTLTHDVFDSAKSYLGSYNGLKFWWGTKVGNKTYDDPMFEFRSDSSLTPETYWAGQKTLFSEAEWKSKLSEYIR